METKPRGREDLARRQGWREARTVLSQLGQFISTRWWRLPRGTAASFVTMTQNQSEALPRRKSIKGSCERWRYWLDVWAAQIKSWVTGDGQQWCGGLLLRGFAVRELHPIRQHTLAFALPSARKEIPEAHFQFMQNHHGKTDSFQFN